MTPTRFGLILAALALTASVATAQTTTTHCNAYSNTMNCTSTTSESAAQRYERDMRQLQQGLNDLGVAIAQRRAVQAAQQAAWAAAATDQARAAASLAKANYEATIAALGRFAADTARSTAPALNGELVLDWSLLHGVETRSEYRNDSGVRWKLLSRWAYTDTPAGGKLLRADVTGPATYKKQHIADFESTLRLDPATGILIITEESRPRFQTVPPRYESTLHAGTHAFATRMEGHGYDAIVPPGVVSIQLLHSAIAVIPGDLPSAFRIWIVNGNGEVLPADITVTARTTANFPAGPVNGTCAGTNGRKEKRDVVILKIVAGTHSETATVLAAAPHVTVGHAEVKCRLIPIDSADTMP